MSHCHKNLPMRCGLFPSYFGQSCFQGTAEPQRFLKTIAAGDVNVLAVKTEDDALNKLNFYTALYTTCESVIKLSKQVYVL